MKGFKAQVFVAPDGRYGNGNGKRPTLSFRRVFSTAEEARRVVAASVMMSDIDTASLMRVTDLETREASGCRVSDAMAEFEIDESAAIDDWECCCGTCIDYAAVMSDADGFGSERRKRGDKRFDEASMPRLWPDATRPDTWGRAAHP